MVGSQARLCFNLGRSGPDFVRRPDFMHESRPSLQSKGLLLAGGAFKEWIPLERPQPFAMGTAPHGNYTLTFTGFA
jgi:hypothetical protein